MIILKSVLRIKRFQKILKVALKSSRKSDERVCAVGIKHEKSQALENFVDNYVIEEEPGVMPFCFSKQKNLLS